MTPVTVEAAAKLFHYIVSLLDPTLEWLIPSPHLHSGFKQFSFNGIQRRIQLETALFPLNN